MSAMVLLHGMLQVLMKPGDMVLVSAPPPELYHFNPCCCPGSSVASDSVSSHDMLLMRLVPFPSAV